VAKVRPHPPPFDQVQRYEVAAVLARAAGATSVLDVGGFFSTAGGQPSLPIRYACHGLRAVVVDIQAPAAGSARLVSGYARADAALLPFADGSFDLVACLDVIEHVPRAGREAVIAELLRVARDYVVIGCPTADDGAGEEEAVVARFVRTAMGAEQEQLAEHRRCGLPLDREILALVPAGARSFGYGNLVCWRLMMLAKYALLAMPHSAEVSAALDAGYAAHAGEAADRVPPFYRRFYLVPARPDAPSAPVEEVAGRFAPWPAAAPGSDAALAGWIFTLFTEADPARRAAERAPLEAKIASLEETFREVESSLVYRLYRLVRR
jgi:SAM-dependent methyltransferase